MVEIPLKFLLKVLSLTLMFPSNMKSPVSLLGRLAISASLSFLVVAHAAAVLVHAETMPAGLPAEFSKSAGNFFYLEGESGPGAATFSSAQQEDIARTLYRTSPVGSTSAENNFWSSAGVGSLNNQVASRGTPSVAAYTNISLYWSNVSLSITTGIYDVWVWGQPGFAGLAAGKTAAETTNTYSFYGGTTQAATDSATSIGSVTMSAATGDWGWKRIGQITITEGLDSFRLSTSTTNAAIAFDTVLLTAAVPEPSAIALGCFALGALLFQSGLRRKN